MMALNKKIGLIGCGFIGRYLYKRVMEESEIEIKFIYDLRYEAAKALDATLAVQNIDAISGVLSELDLVVEAADAEAFRQYAPKILLHTDMIAFSAGAFADDKFQKEANELCNKYNRKVYIPHGAVLGLDGIMDGKHLWNDVSIVTTKSPKSLGRDDQEKIIVYEGAARDACINFPRNANVHAAVSLAGIGLDLTKSQIVADPEAKTNKHEITIKGEGITFQIIVESQSQGGVTGAYTPESSYQTLKRICLPAQNGLIIT